MPTAEANRPPKLPVRVPTEDQRWQRQAAAAVGISYATWVRRVLNQAARRDLRRAARDTDMLASTSDASEDQAP